MSAVASRSVSLLAVLFLAACGNQTANVAQDPLHDNPTFAAIPRDVSKQDVASRQSALSQASSGKSSASKQDASQSFYLAFSKSAIGGKYFLSSYLTQYFPGAVAGGAAESMGTRIVTFQIQNGKLYVLDASQSTATSNSFDPTLVIEAYPLVDASQSASFSGSASSARYYLVDPSAGLNHFNLLSEAYGAGGTSFSVDLSFLQNFRQITDGVTFEQVFTGQASVPINDGTQGEPNLFRASGTLGIAIRKYTEGADYAAQSLPQTGEYFFRSDARIIPNGGGQVQTPISWNIHAGMKPIQWKISPSVNEYKSIPEFNDIDIGAAIKAGVENWNAVFGFKALEATVTDASVNAGDDDVNYILFDEDDTYGAAFANWRTNPDTGEVRGASIYFSSLWLEIADQMWPKDSNAVKSNLGKLVAPQVKQSLTWGNLSTKPLCFLPVQPVSKLTISSLGSLGVLDPQFNLAATDRKAAVEAFLTSLITHELGHTLGLRHNFKGSLTPPSSSVMDYEVYEDHLQLTQPQAYDTAAIQWLYGISKDEPSKYAFCTDENEEYDPDCAIYDQSADPLHTYYGIPYNDALVTKLQGGKSSLYLYEINGLMNYAAVSGETARAVDAYNILMGKIRPPLDASYVSAGGGPEADYFAALVLEKLFADPATFTPSNYAGGGYIGPAQAVGDPQVIALAVNDMSLILSNSDGVRTYPVRRAMVDLLKNQQSSTAYSDLVAAQTKLQAAITGGKLTGDELLNTQDLLARVTRAVSPYYN